MPRAPMALTQSSAFLSTAEGPYLFWRDEDEAVRPGDFGSPFLDHFILVSRATRHAGRHGLVEEGHWKVPEIEQPRVDAAAILESLKNPLRRFFGKATLAGAPYDHRNDGHVSLLSGGLKFSRVSNEESPRTPLTPSQTCYRSQARARRHKLDTEAQKGGCRASPIA